MRQAAPAREIPPPLELACLRVLWSIGEGSVHDVRHLLVEESGKPLAYTTVMTLLDRLVKRGGAIRTKSGRAYLYQPKMERNRVRQAALKELVAEFFNGSEAALLEYLRTQVAARVNIAAPDNGKTE